MNVYRVTYWPGSGEVHPSVAEGMIDAGLIQPKVREIPASSYMQACHISAASFAASSDGCLIELIEGDDPSCCPSCKRGLIGGYCTNQACMRYGTFRHRWNNLRAIIDKAQPDPDRPELVQFVEELLTAHEGAHGHA